MRNFNFLMLAFALMLTGAVTQAEGVNGSFQRPVRVGVILPLSGDSASIGVSIKNGITMAYDKLPAETRSKITLLFEDDQLNPAMTVTAFQKLLNMDRIDVLITGYSGPSKAVAQLAEQKKIPQIAIASDPQIVRGKQYVMNFWVTPEEEARAALSEALKRGYKRIARITAIQQGFLAIKAGFDQQNSGRLRIEIDEEYNPETRDFKTFLAKVKSRNDLDAIFVLLMVNGQTGIFARQAGEMGITLPLFNVEGFEDKNEQNLSQGALVGHWYSTNDDPSGRFLDEYQKRFPAASVFAAGNGHDALLLLAAAVEKNPDSQAINSFLHGVKNFNGALGQFSATSDNRFTLPATVKVVTEHGFKKLYDNETTSNYSGL